MTTDRRITGFRLSVETTDKAHARARMENVPLTAIVEEMLQRYGNGKPQDVETVRARLERKGIEVSGRHAPRR